MESTVTNLVKINYADTTESVYKHCSAENSTNEFINTNPQTTD